MQYNLDAFSVKYVKMHQAPVECLSVILMHAPPPSLQVDPFHTLFGVAGLSLLGDEQIKPVNPVLCMPEDALQRLNLQPELLS